MSNQKSGNTINLEYIDFLTKIDAKIYNIKKLIGMDADISKPKDYTEKTSMIFSGETGKTINYDSNGKFIIVYYKIKFAVGFNPDNNEHCVPIINGNPDYSKCYLYERYTGNTNVHSFLEHGYSRYVSDNFFQMIPKLALKNIEKVAKNIDEIETIEELGKISILCGWEIDAYNRTVTNANKKIDEELEKLFAEKILIKEKHNDFVSRLRSIDDLIKIRDNCNGKIEKKKFEEEELRKKKKDEEIKQLELELKRKKEKEEEFKKKIEQEEQINKNLKSCKSITDEFPKNYPLLILDNGTKLILVPADKKDKIMAILSESDVQSSPNS